MISKRILILVLILVVSLILRLFPVMIFDMPLCYDAPFHINATKELLLVKKIDGINLYYPQVYHVLLAYLSLFSGFDVFTLTKFILPIIASLLCIGIFAHFRNKIGILLAIATAVAIPLVHASFDSPENIAFLLLMGFWIIKDKNLLISEILLALTLFTNYFVFIISSIAYVLFKRKDSLRFLLISSVLICLMNFLGLKLFVGLNPNSGMELIYYNVKNSFPFLILITILAMGPIWYLSLKNKKLNFWSYLGIMSFFGMLSFFITPLLRAWEFPKFFILSSILISGNVLNNTTMRRFFSFLIVLSFIFSLLSASYFIFPRIHKIEINSLKWLEKNYDGKKILAEPSLGEYIIYFTDINKEKISNKLFYERKERIEDKAIKCMLYLRENDCKNYGLWIRNFEDDYFRKLDEKKLKKKFSKIYSLKSKSLCLIKGIDCNDMQTYVLKFKN